MRKILDTWWVWWLPLVGAVVFGLACDEGDVTVNSLPSSPADSAACDTVFIYSDTVCPPETIWVNDPFWECVKECEESGYNRNSKGYRLCMDDCLREIGR